MTGCGVPGSNSAEFASIGQVTIVSKSGTNEAHGSLFDYYSTPWFRAKGFFDSSRASGIRHFPGGSIGGPVWIPKIYDGRNKTFFFFSFETSRGSALQDRLNPTVAPTLQFLIAVLLYHEPFREAHAIAFAAIWTALALYVTALVRAPRLPQPPE